MNKEIADCGAAAGGGGIRLPENVFGSRDGVRGSGPPAFLTKTFSIVNDPNTNSIISWSLLGNSFIIWDHLQFSAEILPKYFKHSNLSSFIYQLNNYGFRKIGVDHQWEYENPNFQSGKIHLLTNIKRRNQNPQRVIRPRPKRTFTNINPKFLRNVNQELKHKIEKLKKQQEEMEFRIMKFEEEVKRIENKSRKLMIYTVKLCDEILFEKIKDENIEETLMEDHEELVKEDLNQLCESRPVWSSDDCEPGLEKKSSDDCEWGLGKNSGDFMFWKKILLEDDEVEVGIEMGKEQAKIALDLEGLISKLD